MTTYRVRVQGANLLMRVEPAAPRRYGFYINWVVDAADPEEAGRKAVANVVADAKLQRAKLNAADDPASCWVEDVAAMPGEPIPAKQQGFVFFPEEPDEEIANLNGRGDR